MPQIYQLPLISEVAPGDQLVVYQVQNGDTRRAPVSALEDYLLPVSSADVTFQPAGSGAVQRTAESKMRDVVSVKDFGAVGDGVTDDSAAFNAALAAANTVYLPWAVYRVKDITISTHKSLYGNGSIIRAAASAANIFNLTGFKPYLADCYLDDASANILPSIGVNGGVVIVDAIYPTVTNCQFLNMHSGLVLRVSSVIPANQVTKGTFSDLVFDTIQSRGIYIGPNVNSCVFDNAQMYVGQVPSGGNAIPKAGCIGFQIVSTGTNNAAGGHFVSKIAVLEAETGFDLTDAVLVNFEQCIADSLKGAGYQINGACNYIKFNNCFAGTCLEGFKITGTSSFIWLNSVDTVLQGVVPPWGDPTNFFNAGSPFDISIKNTASVRVGAWMGDTYLWQQDNGASVSFDGGSQLYSASTSAISSATTVYFTPVGQSATEELTFVAPQKGLLYGLSAQSVSAPGAGQSYTYTARVAFADTLLTCQTSGASAFGSSANYPVTFNAGDNITVKLVTSASAASGNHRVVAQLRYF